MKMTMRYPGGLKKAVTFSYDDGVKADESLIGIMVKYGIRGTFNLNGCKYVDEDRKMLELAQKISLPNGMEIACHGFRHPFYEDLNEEVEEENINNGYISLKKVFAIEIDEDAIKVLNKIPFLAATPLPTIIATGVAKPNAQGQLITKNVNMSFKYSF